MTGECWFCDQLGFECRRCREERLAVEVEQLRGAVDRVEAVLAHARLVSPSRAMTVYVTDVAAALAGDA